MHKQWYPKRWREIREAVKERAQHRCEVCGIEEGTIQVSRHTGRRYILYLHAAHLGDHPCDGRLRHLRCLCPACHMRLDRQHESQTRKSARRRGYQITTTDRLVAALSAAGLSITETERGYDWQMDDLQGHATTAIQAVVDAIYALRPKEAMPVLRRKALDALDPTEAQRLAHKLGQLQAQLLQLLCLHDDEALVSVCQQFTAQFADEVVHDLCQVMDGGLSQSSQASPIFQRGHSIPRNDTAAAHQWKGESS